MIANNCCFMYNPQIPNFYIANLKTLPFNGKLDRPIEPHTLVSWSQKSELITFVSKSGKEHIPSKAIKNQAVRRL